MEVSLRPQEDMAALFRHIASNPRGPAAVGLGLRPAPCGNIGRGGRHGRNVGERGATVVASVRHRRYARSQAAAGLGPRPG